jgi:hypothetical protein
MRIAYVSLHWPRRKASGIGRKIEEQLAAWQQAGHTARFFSHRVPVDDPSELVDGIGFEYKPVEGAAGKILTEVNRCRAIPAMVKAVREFSPDIIYLRWSMYVFPSHRLFDIAPVVVEINTDDVSQHEMLGKVYSLYNRLTRRIYLSQAAGLVYASAELQTSQSFTHFNRPGVVIANGIDLEKNPIVPAPHNKRPRIGFIGTPDMTWQGVDKIARLAELCPDIDIDVIGSDTLPGGSNLPSNLMFHGYLDKEEARRVLSGDDVGLGTVALHRKAMDEASSLKTREYLAYGIPIIVPYKDTDLEDLKLDTILRIPNTEDTIEKNWQVIRNFTYSMQGKRVKREDISNRIDAHVKEEQRLIFFAACLNR